MNIEIIILYICLVSILATEFVISWSSRNLPKNFWHYPFLFSNYPKMVIYSRLRNTAFTFEKILTAIRLKIFLLVFFSEASKMSRYTMTAPAGGSFKDAAKMDWSEVDIDELVDRLTPGEIQVLYSLE